METIKINNTDYYLADDIYKLEPFTFPKCTTTTRNIVKTKKLNDSDYIFVKQSKDSWILSTSTYSRAKLALNKSWCKNNVLSLKENKTKDEIASEVLPVPPLLEVSDIEKFRDIEGNIYDVEMRGRSHI